MCVQVCVSFLLLSLTVRPEVEESAFMAPCRDSVKSLTLDLYAIHFAVVVVVVIVIAAALGTSRLSLPSINLPRVSLYLCVGFRTCVSTWVYNQVNAFAKCLVQLLNSKDVVALPSAISHTPRGSNHMYCICVRMF